MYYGGYSNDFFYVTPVYACSGYARVQSTVFGDTTNCPFTNQQLDINFGFQVAGVVALPCLCRHGRAAASIR